MIRDIAESDYAGGMIFSWQDEWFKQTWNTSKFSPDNPSQRTPNRQSAEQNYGILAMEPGSDSICIIDGKNSEWKNQPELIKTDGVSIKTNYDEEYLYICLESSNFDFDKETLYVPIQISELGSKFAKKYGLSFTEAVDFILVVNGENNTRLLSDSYEDLFKFMYSVEKEVFPLDKYPVKKSGEYNTIKQFLSNEIILPLTNVKIAPKLYESGLLQYGIGDPNYKNFNSLADFYCKNNTIEIRIPWYLLNVQNSTIGARLNDFYKDKEIYTEKIESIKIGVTKGQKEDISLYDIGYKAKEKSTYHTRLKKSYDIIKNGLKAINIR